LIVGGDLAPFGRPFARLAVYRRAAQQGVTIAPLLGDVAKALPFKLGEGPRDWAVPYAWDDRIDSLSQAATEELCDLLVARRQPGEETGPSGPYALRKSLLPWANRLAASAAELDPHLDPGLTLAWCDRSAGALGDALCGVFLRAAELELSSEPWPPFGYFVALACAGLSESLKATVKSRAVRGMTYERFEKAVGLALFSLVDLAAERALEQLGRRPIPVAAGPVLDRMRLVLNPLLYCSIRTRALQNTLNPWGIGEGLLDLWQRKVRRVEDLSQPLARIEAATREALGDASLQPIFAAAGRRARIRWAALEALLELDRAMEEPWTTLRSALSSEERLEALQREPKAITSRLPTAAAQTRWMAPLVSLLEAQELEAEDLETAVVACLSFRLDRMAADQLDRVARTLRDERNHLPRETLIGQYEQGRLYRLSADGKPLLRSVAQAVTGHLFVDLKGFTRRTARAKEIVVADFLQREFYEPILQAAGAAAGEGDEIQLLNLVGDGAAFSGPVPALVDLANEIRRISVEYQRKLAGVNPAALLAEQDRQRRAIQRRLAAAEEPLRLEIASLEAEIGRRVSLAPEAQEFARLGTLSRALKGVRDEASRELAHLRRSSEAAVGAGLEAGVFISFGAAAEEIRMDDPAFGQVRVAIAEKLNEAARGTGRAYRVAAEADEELRKAILSSGNPQLKEPFSVHLGAEQARVATDIYNAGAALSAEALDAFLRATLGPRLHFEKFLHRPDFSAELAAAFALPETLHLIVSVGAEAPLASALFFREAGRVAFRGFEEGCVCEVFELLADEGRFARLLVQNHLAHWIEEARSRPHSFLSSLRPEGDSR
jgi:hypothetical protein